MSTRTAFSIALFFCYGCISAENQQWLDEFEHHSDLDSQGSYEFYWTPHPDECYIEFGLEVETAGWAAIGISASGGMSPGDVVVGWVDGDGVTHLYNAYTTGKSTPIQFDDQTGIELIEGWEEDIDGTVKTYLRFEKELFPSENRAYSVDVQIGTTRVIYAWNQVDPIWDNELIYMSAHSNSDRGPKSLNLLSGESPFVERPPDARYTDVLQPAVNVPSSDTTYWCTLLEVEGVPEIEHIIEIEPIIEEVNAGIVHHFVLSVCPAQFVEPEFVGAQWDCSETANMPTNKSHCTNGYAMYAWAVGGGTFYFPEHVGMNIGADSVRYFQLQTHYDNPLEVAGFVDSSGLRLWHTPTLREETASIFAIGDGYDQFIPPGIPSTLNYAYFPAVCSEGIPEGGVKAFANMHHQHLLGRAGVVRHIRDGKELAPIAVDLAYDFDYQQYVPFKDEVAILPGDEFIVECEIDSTDAVGWTKGGESTRDEMCFSFLMVYPAMEMSSSVTSFLPDDKTKFLADAAALGYIDEETEEYDVTVEGALQFYNEFQSFYRRLVYCPPIKGEFETILIPSGFEEYEMENNFGCGDIAESSTSGFEWYSWYGLVIWIIIYLLLVCLLFIILGLIVAIFVCFVARYKICLFVLLMQFLFVLFVLFIMSFYYGFRIDVPFFFCIKSCKSKKMMKC